MCDSSSSEDDCDSFIAMGNTYDPDIMEEINHILDPDSILLHDEYGDYHSNIEYITLDDKKKALLILKISPIQYCNLSRRLQEDVDIVEMAVKTDGHVYKYIPVKFQAQKKILMSAMDTWPGAMTLSKKAGLDAYSDDEIIFKAIRCCNSGSIFEYHLTKFFTKKVENDPNLLKDIYINNPRIANLVAMYLDIKTN